MFDRIHVEAGDGDERLSIDTDESSCMVISFAQAKQLILDVQKILDGEIPDDEPSVEGVE